MSRPIALLTMQQTVILLIARQSFHIHVSLLVRLTGRRSENYTRRMIERLVAEDLLERTGETAVTAGRSATCYRITEHGRFQLASTLEAIDSLRDAVAAQRMIMPMREHTMAPVLVRANYGDDTVVQSGTT